MRKLLTIFFLLCVILFKGYAQYTKTINLSFSENDFSLIQVNEGKEFSSLEHILFYEPDTLAPALPYIAVNVLLDADKEYGGHTFCYTDSLVRDSIFLNANRLDEPMSAPHRSQPRIISYGDTLYPHNLIEYKGMYVMGGYKYAAFLVSPFQYNAVTHKLFLNTHIDLTINQQDQGVTSQGVASMRNAVKRLVHNREEVDSLYQTNNIPVDYDYLLITNNALKPAFQKLADWKTTKGVRTKILTIEEIRGHYIGMTDQIKIKSAIQDYYNGQHQGLQYVLLGGDVGIIPTQNCYVHYNYQNYTDHTPTDWFYGSLSDLDWDTNNNGEVGEIDDSINIVSDVIVSRISVSTNNEANTIIDRIVNYEKAPNINNWADNIFMSGRKLYYNGNFSNNHYNQAYLSDTNFNQMIHLYYSYIAPYWDGHVTKLFDTETDFEGGADYDFNVEHLQTELSKGYTFVNVVTHGAATAFQMEGTWPAYTKQDADSLVNTGYSCFIPQSCSTNAIDWYTDCLGETFMKNPNSGMLCYWGASRFSFEGPARNMVSAFYKLVLNGGTHQVGRAICEAKNSFVGKCNEYRTANRWILFTYNLLGDPEMPVFLSRPQKFEHVDASVVNGALTININEDDCKVCVMSADDVGASYYHVEDSISSVSLSNIPEEATICITKTGYIPYILHYSNNPMTYIQNETFAEDKNFLANEVLIGSNVTTDKEEGPVSIENGKTIVKSTRGVTIKNDFEVKSGAEFGIYPN